MAVTGPSSAMDALQAAGVLLAAAGLSPGMTGNMSVRSADRIYVTASGVMLGDVGELAEIDHTGAHISGRRPTKEAPMHAAVYGAGPRWQAAIHLHSTFATLLSTLEDLDEQDAIPAITPYLTMKAGRVGVIPYETPGSPVIGRHVAGFIAAGGQACLMRNHGSLVVGASIDATLALAFELEESAKLAVLGRGLQVVALTAAQRAALVSL